MPMVVIIHFEIRYHPFCVPERWEYRNIQNNNFASLLYVYEAGSLRKSIKIAWYSARKFYMLPSVVRALNVES
jgi:hypothetical protein